MRRDVEKSRLAFVDLILELFLPALAIAASLPVLAAGGLELLFESLHLGLGSTAGVFELAALCLQAVELELELGDGLFELGAVVLRLGGLQFLRQPRLQNTGVGNQALGDIEARAAT